MTTTRDTMLRAYDFQLRGPAEVVGAHDVTRIGPLWFAVFGAGSGFIGYRDLGGATGADLDELIESALAHIRGLPQITEVEWKTRGHDAPADLPSRLIDHGFAPEEAETVMVGEAAHLDAEVDLPDGVVVRRAGVGGDLTDDVERAHQLAERVFSRSSGQTMESQVEGLRKSAHLASLWIAEAGDTVVSAGRLVIVEETDFAGLWAGVTHPDWRRRGIYRALTAARAHHAVESGVTYLQSDCTPDVTADPRAGRPRGGHHHHAVPVAQGLTAHWPVRPSMHSRSRSACPACRAYSSIRWTSTSRTTTVDPSPCGTEEPSSSSGSASNHASARAASAFQLSQAAATRAVSASAPSKASSEARGKRRGSSG